MLPDWLKMCSCSVVLFLTASIFSTTRALPASCKTDWKIDWNQQTRDLSNFQPFSNPGEVLQGFTVNDTLQFVGLLWNAPSWQEMLGRVCIQYGPLLIGVYPEEQIRRECDLLVSSLQKGQKSDVLGTCALYWDTIGVENVTRNFISDYDQCLQFRMIQRIPGFDSPLCDLDPLLTVYATSLLEKGSHIAFDLLEWLGPSPFSGDVYGVCSALRILLSMDIDQIVDKVKNLLTYIIADTLEYLNSIDICGNVDQVVEDILNQMFTIFFDDDEDFCDFLSWDPSPEEYLQKSEKLIDTVFDVVQYEMLCIDVLTFLSSYDQYEAVGYQITGWDLTSQSNRKEFCREIASALSDQSLYIPTPYSFSFGDSSSSESNSNYRSSSAFFSSPFENSLDFFLSSYFPKSGYHPPQYTSSSDSFLFDAAGTGNGLIYAEAGEFLPDFSFIEAVNVLGAFLRSETLSDGGVVLCDVFESFLFEFEPSVSTICTGLRNDDTATVEKMCLTLSLQSENFHPSLRIPNANYMVVAAIDMARKLLELSLISRDQVCLAVNNFFHSNNNLQSVVRFGVDVYLAELLPIADAICEDYDAVLDFLEGKTKLNPTDYQNIEDFILTHLGFSDRNQLCQTIDAGIDSFSGRARMSLVGTMQNQVLLFLTDSERCQESAESLQRIFQDLSMETDFPDLLTQYTGYDSISSVCGNLSIFFDDNLCKAKSRGCKADVYSLFMALTVFITYLLSCLE